MKVSALSSGSSGNCFYIEKNDSAILVDIGISAKRVEERLNLLNCQVEKIKGIFITHEHTDHIIGVDVFSRRYNIPIFATKGTITNGHLCSNRNLINPIKNNDIVDIGEFEIEAFKKSHKAADPVSYSISDKNKVACVITDAGYACENIHDKISKSDFLFIESNHDIKMLENGGYPAFLKKWVKSDLGHLSNNQAALAVLEHGHRRLKHIVLSHISKTNNSPDVAMNTFGNLLRERSDLNTNLSVSLDNSPTRLFNV
ncbi:MBL fold metallo-hydrolase [Candidatus Pacearchaeota archaeon CG10_big_fil_rev_8_21_14_0_10_32_14]|nr:MAG: MBL fold metallo-hydrolase [Candidatus Pacearchaeota archaeon CG10_big_fil_rev_8_21_14_0_10_32_14]